MRFKIRYKTSLPLLLLSGILLYASGSFSNDRSNLKKVDKSKTCMASNMYAGKESGSFTHGEKKYYGCSDMCIRNLELNTIYRYETDPVSGKLVDKATALVAADESGRLFYFESEKTFKAFH